jgi:tetratricopeptide (TPR) repeat protein
MKNLVMLIMLMGLLSGCAHMYTPAERDSWCKKNFMKCEEKFQDAYKSNEEEWAYWAASQCRLEEPAKCNLVGDALFRLGRYFEAFTFYKIACKQKDNIACDKAKIANQRSLTERPQWEIEQEMELKRRQHNMQVINNAMQIWNTPTSSKGLETYTTPNVYFFGQ